MIGFVQGGENVSYFLTRRTIGLSIPDSPPPKTICVRSSKVFLLHSDLSKARTVSLTWNARTFFLSLEFLLLQVAAFIDLLPSWEKFDWQGRMANLWDLNWKKLVQDRWTGKLDIIPRGRGWSEMMAKLLLEKSENNRPINNESLL